MGREIRRVPAGWKHPRIECPHRLGGHIFRGRQVCHDAAETGQCCQPLQDQDFESTARKWMDAAIAWDNGTDPDCAEHKAKHPFYWQWAGNPPNPKYYRPKWTDEERTHFQMYETVSEGTPVTPVFATKEELIEYLVQYGDDWSDGQGWKREHAVAFVEREWAPSMIIVTGGSDAGIYKPQNGIPNAMKKE